MDCTIYTVPAIIHVPYVLNIPLTTLPPIPTHPQLSQPSSDDPGAEGDSDFSDGGVASRRPGSPRPQLPRSAVAKQYNRPGRTPLWVTADHLNGQEPDSAVEAAWEGTEFWEPNELRELMAAMAACLVSHTPDVLRQMSADQGAKFVGRSDEDIALAVRMVWGWGWVWGGGGGVVGVGGVGVGVG